MPVIDADHDAAVRHVHRGAQGAAVRVGGGEAVVAQRAAERYSRGSLPWAQVAGESEHERERAGAGARASADVEALLEPKGAVGPPLPDVLMRVVDAVGVHGRLRRRDSVKGIGTAVTRQGQTRSRAARGNRGTRSREPGREILRG